MSETSDALVKQLFGDDGLSQTDRLWMDFQRVATVILLRDFCHRQPDPKEVGERFIKSWKERIIAQAEKEIKQREDVRASNLGQMFSRMIPSADESRGGLQDELNDIEAILRRSLELS